MPPAALKKYTNVIPMPNSHKIEKRQICCKLKKVENGLLK